MDIYAVGLIVLLTIMILMALGILILTIAVLIKAFKAPSNKTIEKLEQQNTKIMQDLQEIKANRD